MIRLYIADLAAYNESELVGEWVDLDDYTDSAEIEAFFHNQVRRPCGMDGCLHEEFAIHDIDTDIPALTQFIGEYTPFTDCLEWKEALSQVPEAQHAPFSLWLERQSASDLEGDVYAQFQAAFLGTASSLRDWLDEQIVEAGLSQARQDLSDLGARIDPNEYALQSSGIWWVFDGGNVHVFEN